MNRLPETSRVSIRGREVSRIVSSVEVMVEVEKGRESWLTVFSPSRYVAYINARSMMTGQPIRIPAK